MHDETRQPPATLWLQWWDEDGQTPQHIDGHDTGATWCDDKVHATDVLYVRAGAAPAAAAVAVIEAGAIPIEAWEELARHLDAAPAGAWQPLPAPEAIPAGHAPVPLDLLRDVARHLFVGHASDPHSTEVARLRTALYSIIGKARGI